MTSGDVVGDEDERGPGVRGSRDTEQARVLVVDDPQAVELARTVLQREADWIEVVDAHDGEAPS